MYTLSSTKQRWPTRQRDQRRQKSLKDLSSIKMKNNTIWFSQENLNNYKDVIKNSKLEDIRYVAKLYHVAMVVQVILWDIVTQSLTTPNFECLLFPYSENYIIKMQK